MKTDRELLELAAKAAECDIVWNPKAIGGGSFMCLVFPEPPEPFSKRVRWNPLTDDGDALRLAQRLAIEIKPSNRHDYGQAAGNVSVCRDDLKPIEALRRAIVMAAAEMA